jgi:Taurine catabolism dioxygenase TauD, TfdA family
MTTNTEELQPIWSISGLAEVLSSRAAGEQADDEIVRFNRNGRPDGHTWHTALSNANLRRLGQWGYVVVADVESPTAAEEIVGSLGEVIHEVTYLAGNDRPAHSQNTNTVLARTEAPGWHPTPAYLALYCHRQARCGGGHTDLLDVRRLVAALHADEIALMTEADLHFPGPDGGVHGTMLSTDAAGDTVARFSYNLLTTSDYDPALGAEIESRRLPLGEAGLKLAHRVSDLFGQLSTSVLIPDGALLIWDNQRMLHAPTEYADRSRHLTQFWSTDWRRA